MLKDDFLRKESAGEPLKKLIFEISFKERVHV